MLKKFDENLLLFSTKFVEQKEYWLNKLSADIEKTAIGSVHSEMPPSGDGIEKIRLEISRELSERLMNMSNRSDLSLYIVLLAALKTLIYRYGNNEHIIIRSPLYRLNISDETLNDFLLIYDGVHGHMTFRELVLAVSRSVLDAYENQDYPFDKLIEASFNIPASQVHGSFTDVECSLQSIHANNHAGDLQCRFALEFELDKESVHSQVIYNAHAYEREFIQRFVEHYKAILESSVMNVDARIATLSFLSEEEREQLIFGFNRTETFPEEMSVCGFIQNHASRSADRIALSSDHSHMTYFKLNQRANRWARIFKEKGLEEGNLAAVLLDRSFLMAEAIIAAWKLGCAYIPVDPQDPTGRILNIIGDSDAGLLVRESRYADLEVGCDGVETVETDLLVERVEDGGDENPELLTEPEGLAYIIYTSGSTGKPKGAMIEHPGMMNHIQNKIVDLRITDESIIAQNASHTFDISVWQFFAALVAGGRTVIYPEEIVLSAGPFLDRVVNDRITILEVVPSYLSIMLELLDLKSRTFQFLRYLLVTGETVNPRLVDRWYEKYSHIEVVNAYGPTEASDDITHGFIGPGSYKERVPIGRPLANLNIYIVDRHMQLCPVGVKGEICVSGTGIGRGYLNRPEQTRSVFSVDPFLDRSEVRLYKTGDLGCFRNDGSIDFFGRKDYQVKIRGHRIELGEIEQKLARHPLVKEALIIDAEHQGIKSLWGYYIPRNRSDSIEFSEMRQYLLKELPDYMVPAYLVQLDRFPLTSNGKVDRKKLPEPTENLTEKRHLPPRSDLEKRLVDIWAEVLGIDKDNIGIDVNFFELGGDSINAIQISARLQKYQLNLDIKDIFLNPTIEQLAKCVKRVDRIIDQQTVTGVVELTPIQRWFFETHFAGGHHFNQSLMIHSKAGFKRESVQKVFEKIVEHHDALRMIFDIRGDRDIIQRNRDVDEGSLFDFEFLNMVGKSNIGGEIARESNRIQGGINLHDGPLIRLGQFHTPEGDHLLLVIHHLVIDGISWRILMEDFAIGYQQLERGEEVRFQNKTDSFKYWSEKFIEYSDHEAILEDLEYWKAVERCDVKSISRDFEAEGEQKKYKYNRTITMYLDEQETENLLKEVNRAFNTDINDILLSALGLAVREWGGLDKVLINLEGHGRDSIFSDINISRTVGWYTSQFPVLLDMGRWDDLAGYIKTVKETLRNIPNDGMSYGILRYLTPAEKKGDFTFSLKPEISFNYLGQIAPPMNLNDIGASTMSMGDTINPELHMQYAVDINGKVEDKRLEMSFTYNRNEYEESHIKRLADSYYSNLNKLINYCMNREDSELTLSDFTSKSIDQQDLDTIFDDLENLA